MKKLTIAIPTYNRVDAILDKVKELSTFISHNKMESNIELLIMDNNSSEYDIYKLLKEFKYLDFISIKRNVVNIGAGANFLKCIEQAKAEYIWLLGDDEILDLNYLNKLLSNLKNKDCYLLPHNESYAKHATYFGDFNSIDELFDKFWNLGSFFVLSTYVFKKESALKYLKNGYEAVLYQHPYSAIALAMLNDNRIIELVNTPLLKVQNLAYTNPRFDIINAYIDVVSSVKNFCNKQQFNKYLEKDFYPAREKTVFTFNLGLTKKLDVESLILNYKRLISIVPFFSKIHIKSIMWINIAKLRKLNKITSMILFFLSRIKINRFSKMSLNDIYIYISSNLSTNQNHRH